MGSRALARYYRILEDEEEPRYLMSKKVRLDARLEAGTKDLWASHDALLSMSGTSRGGNSLLDLKVELARRMLQECTLCERKCRVNRSRGEKGRCGVLDARVSADFLHMGEEPDLVPSYTVFFTGCTFGCVYCQNWDISTRPDSGTMIAPGELARKIEAKSGGGRERHALYGIGQRARNVNWVGGDPTSNLPFILEVLRDCRAKIPQVWNSNMYLSEEGMRLLDGVIDVYLTDFKYGNDKCALRLSNAKEYMRVVRRNHVIARGNGEMIIRHLVLPGHIECCTRPALAWIAENLDDVLVNVMSQYRPEHRAGEFAELARPISISEYEKAIGIADSLGLELCQ
jgi:putative pyruvate formate lyase activating enzyme